MLLPILTIIACLILLVVWIPDFIGLLSGTKQFNTANPDDRLTVTIAIFIIILEGGIFLFKNIGVLLNA